MGITYKELEWLQNPGRGNDKYMGGCLGCPGNTFCGESGENKCRECWNKEIPYPVIAEVTRPGGYGFTYRVGEKFLVDSVGKPLEDASIFIRPMEDKTSYVIRDVCKNDFKFYIDKGREGKLDMNTFQVGDKVRIEGTIEGCRGAEGMIGFVTDDKLNHGLNDDEFGINVKVCEGEVWRVNEDSLYPVDYTLSDLKDGMIVEVMDGSRQLFLNGKFHAYDTGFVGIQQDLTNSYGRLFDVVKVFAPSQCKGFQNMLDNPGELLWKRKEVKEISAEEMFKVLSEHYGCDVKIKKEGSI